MVHVRTFPSVVLLPPAVFLPEMKLGVRVNLALALLNLLPLRTLDGGPILVAALCRRRLPQDAGRICKTIAVITVFPLTAICWHIHRKGGGSYVLLLSLFSVVLDNSDFSEWYSRSAAGEPFETEDFVFTHIGSGAADWVALTPILH